MSTFQKYPFQTVYSNLHELYGIDMNIDTMETAALIAWNYIGNKDCKIYRAVLPVHPNGEGTWEAELPCNCFVVESVTSNWEDFKKTSNKFNSVGSLSSAVEESIEYEKLPTSDLYQSGKLVSYRQIGDKLYFQSPFDSVNVIYKGLYLDDEGLPYLSLKEVQAIMSYCAYTYFYKKAVQNTDANSLQLASNEQNMWLKRCTQARVPDYLNQNEINDILDAKTTWNRKSYGYSYKPYGK